MGRVNIPMSEAAGARAVAHDANGGDRSRLRPVSRPGTGTVDEESACPVCGHATGTRSGLYLHLQIDHRKSELARVLLDTDE